MAKSAVGSNLLRQDAVVSYTALIEAATGSTQTLFALPAGSIVQDCFVDTVIPFNDTDGTITSVTVKVGVSGSTGAFTANVNIFSGTATAGSRASDVPATSTKRVFSSAGNVIATFTGDANLGDGSATALEAGLCRISVLYYSLPIAGA
jgi:hypothetical protein|tara:strand:+ start:1069 stop:1515 length:447 start_codon:yes stop_codon:yes gene_type:complete